MPTYVVSTTLSDPGWANTTVLAQDAVARIGELEQRSRGDIVQHRIGSCRAR
jgi:hypothetical protein